MASQLIGRTKCPECDFASAHVKRSEKCLYRYCPECGSSYMATGPEREALLMAKTRLLTAAPVPAPPEPEKTPESGQPAPAPAIPEATQPPAAPKGRGLFGMR
jgi:hypothetical protein